MPANWPNLSPPPQPHAHTPPTCPGPSSTRGIVQGWRRESAVFGSGRSESDAQRPRTRQPVCSASPAHCQSDPLLIFGCHSQLGEYKTLEGKRKSLFRSFLLQTVVNGAIAQHFRGALRAALQQIGFIFGGVVIFTQ